MLKSLKRFFRKSEYQSEEADERLNKSGRGGYRIRPEFRCAVCIALCLAFYFIASNSGSGWLYLLSAALCVVVGIGLLGPILTCMAVGVSQQAPARCVSGQVLTIVSHLGSRLPFGLPLFWLRVSYEFQGKRTAPVVARAVEDDEPCMLKTPPVERGVHRPGDVVVTTCFPLGMLWCERRFPAAQGSTITAYPRTMPVDGFFLYKLTPSAAGSGGLARGSRSARQSTSTRGIREYVRGDSPRIVHWASSARTGKLLVREFEAEGLPRFDIYLDLNAGWENARQFEMAVTATASLLSLGYRLGTSPRLLITPEETISRMDIPGCTPGIEWHMEVLARVKRSSGSRQPHSAFTPGSDAERTVVAIVPEGTPMLPNCYTIEIGSSQKDKPDSLREPVSSLQRPVISSRPLILSDEDIRLL